jgi:hypothetical protein
MVIDMYISNSCIKSKVIFFLPEVASMKEIVSIPMANNIGCFFSNANIYDYIT